MKNHTFEQSELYQKQCIEDYLHRPISLSDFRSAKAIANQFPANNMQERVKLIARCVGR